MYSVYNRITGATIEFKSRKVASNYADRMDFNYGAVICTVRPIWMDR